GDPRAQARGRTGPASDRGLAARGAGVLGNARPRPRAPEPADLGSSAAAVVRRMDGVVGGGRQASLDRLHLLDRSTVLARGTARIVRCYAAHLLFLHG